MLRKLTAGTPLVCTDRGTDLLHKPHRDVVNTLRERISDMESVIFRTMWFATTVKT
ncbi:MAG: hypothetical protein LBS77_07085 [Desulfovibrio sp.]|nr:hypothetical protein [Desulfovibrio sp.]